MTQISLRDLHASMERWGSGMILPTDLRETYSLEKASIGYLGGIQASYSVAHNISIDGDELSVAIRAGAVIGNRANASATIVNRNMIPSGTMLIETEQVSIHSVSYDPSAFPLQLGITYSSPVKKRYSLNAAAFAGPGFVRVVSGVKSQTNGATASNYTVTYAGTALAATFLIGGGYRLTERISIGLDIAFRYCKTYLKASSDAGPPGSGIRKGDPLAFMGDKTTVSLGGVGGTLSLTYRL